jgi:hypothetical protein
VIRVGFDLNKVLYDLAVIDPVENLPYLAYPLCSIDSIFIWPVPNTAAEVIPVTEINQAVQNLDAVVTAGAFRSESKGKSKKKKTPRQMLYSVMMRQLAGPTGDELAEAMMKNDEDELRAKFGNVIGKMLADFQKKVKEEK